MRFEQPWLRFHAYVVGLPKTGSTSLSAMMRNYRTGHEVWLDFLAAPGVARARGEIDDDAFWETVKRRFVPLRAEMDSVTCHHLYAEILNEKYPKAQFIATYRDVRSWANSLLDLVTATARVPPELRDGKRTWMSSYGAWIGEGTIPFDHDRERDDSVALPALMRSWAAYMRRMPPVLPPDRTLWIKTPELTARVPDLADFLKIPVDSIVMENVHSNKTAVSFDRFAVGDREIIDGVYMEHCADLMMEHFPEEHARFLTRAHSDTDDGWSTYIARVDAALAAARAEQGAQA